MNINEISKNKVTSLPLNYEFKVSPVFNPYFKSRIRLTNLNDILYSIPFFIRKYFLSRQTEVK